MVNQDVTVGGLGKEEKKLSIESCYQNRHPPNLIVYKYIKLFVQKPSNSKPLKVMPEQYKFSNIAKSNTMARSTKKLCPKVKGIQMATI